MKIIDGSITSPKGFKATGAAVGIKANGKNDLALIYSEKEAVAAGVFTTNVVKAAPVIWDKKIIESSNKIRGIIVNSGNANACTGKEGDNHTKLIAETYAKCIGANEEQILVSSTGVIGVLLPIDKLIAGIKANVGNLSSDLDSGKIAAESIMTTDTFKKEVVIQLELSGKQVTIAGMAKGSGMIHPNMATLLSFITTDVNINRDLLQKLLVDSVKASYNMISVDRDTSTNDTAIVIANGMAENDELIEGSEDFNKFREALNYVNTELAKKIARDGEGATKFIQVDILKASTEANARLLAKSVISSNLTKAALFGEDANWGRVLCAMGYSGAKFDINKVKVSFSSKSGKLVVSENGIPVKFDEAIASKILSETDINIIVEMNEGEATATAWGCDLSYGATRFIIMEAM